MADSLTQGIEPQPDFPHVDITEGNARMLAVILANEYILREFHEAAEQTSLLFRISHLAVVNALRVACGTNRAFCANIGVTIYEASSALIRYEHPQPKTKLIQSAISLKISEDEDWIDYLTRTLATFQEEMPQTNGIVAEVSASLGSSDITYARLGAAIARDVALCTN